MKIMIDTGAFMPLKAHKNDAGYDLFSPISAIVPSHGSAVIDSGVHMELKKDTVGMVKSRSGLYFKNSLTTEGVIDSGYTGSIGIKIVNHSDNDYIINRGDKIAQIVILKLADADDILEIVDSFEETSRGNGGFGSSGR